MKTALENRTAAAELATLPTVAEDIAAAKEYAAASKAANTRRAYAADLRKFAAYAERIGADASAAGTVAAYIAHLAQTGSARASINRALAAIRADRADKGQVFEVAAAAKIRDVLAGINRELAPGTCKAPLLVEDLRTAVADLPADTVASARDRALLLVGFALGARRSELAALDVADLEWSARGVSVTIRRSKTDQLGAGRVVALPVGKLPATCPVRALRTWLDVAGIAEGAIWRSINKQGTIGARLSDKSIAQTVKDAGERAGLNPATLGGHSLRAGLVTSASLAGASDASIQRQTGHRSVTMLRRYTRVADAYRDNATAGLL